MALIAGGCLLLTGCDDDGRRCVDSETIYIPQTTQVNNIPITTIIPYEICNKYEEKETP